MSERPTRPTLRRTLPLAVVLAASVTALVVVGRPPRPLSADERVVLFPSDASRDPASGDWRVTVRGWVYEPEHDDRLRQTLVDALRELVPTPSAEARDIFDRRLRLFLADNQGHKTLRVRIAGRPHQVGPTDSAGHFATTVTVAAEDAASSTRDGALAIELLAAGAPPVSTRARLLDVDGISVISDIDDTIKITEVRDRRALVQNTFARPFRSAPGMAALYRDWARGGVAFHYVSSSPWQLYVPLERFMRRAGFPPATLSLKRFQLTDSSLLDLLADPRETKPPAIARILEAHAGRRFCLVGDSGEKDPEVYGQIARTHRGRILHIYIRDVTDEPADAPRYQQAFAGLPRQTWTVFRDPTDLPPCRED